MVTLESHIAACTSDIYDAVLSGRYTLEMQVRAYDLLDLLLDMKENGTPAQVPAETAAEYCLAYEKNKDILDSMVDWNALKAEAEAGLAPYSQALEEARRKADDARTLHELAKETFGIWQSSGIFSRQKALRRLRKSAGFRLESHRIGNYVAKTYDLMEEARRAHQKAQQALFSANVAYKCRSGVLEGICFCLEGN